MTISIKKSLSIQGDVEIRTIVSKNIIRR